MNPFDTRKLRRFLTSLRPPEVAWRGASFGLWALAAALVVVPLGGYVLTDFSWPKLLTFGTIVLALLGAGLGLRLAWFLLKAIPPRLMQTLLLLLPLSLALLIPGLGTSVAAQLFALLAVTAMLGGGVLYLLRQQGWGRLGHWRVALVCALAMLLPIGAMAVWNWPEELGIEEQRNPFLAELEKTRTAKALDGVELGNPSAPGPHGVLRLTYGSGEDLRRAEYGADVDVVARSVDGSKWIDGWKDDLAAKLRTRYWGFGVDALPLQGRVFLPEGQGPFPLILIVHGNHPMEDFSDVGYAYLGELLASRGSIVVSVDQNFLNSSFADEVNPFGNGGLREENDARGWLMLEHVRQWADWNTDPEHRFHGLVDLRRVMLVGHSRGGEAVITAAEIHGLGRHPDDANRIHDYDFFDLRGIVAIAPVDGQYQPRKRRHRLVDTNYFVIHGSLDGDVQSFMGTSVFERARFTEAGRDRHRFAASLYLIGANHGQFNTDWGACDYGKQLCWVFDTEALMPAEDQRKVAQVYISAFAETVFADPTALDTAGSDTAGSDTADWQNEGYLPLFRDPRIGGADGAGWMPDVHAIANYADNRQRILVDYEEDLDPDTASVSGGRLEGRHLSRWWEVWPELKWQALESHVAIVAWDERTREEGEVASYGLKLGSPLAVDPATDLIFELADADDSSLPEDWEEGDGEEGESEPEEEGDGEEAEEKEELVDWTVVLVDDAGRSARLPLSHDQPLVPRIDSRAKKLSLLSSTASSELVLRRYAFPIADFLAIEPSLDTAAIREIRFDFDRSERGTVVLDGLGFSGPLLENAPVIEKPPTDSE